MCWRVGWLIHPQWFLDMRDCSECVWPLPETADRDVVGMDISGRWAGSGWRGEVPGLECREARATVGCKTTTRPHVVARAILF
jgi:hypothetical protein